jgi:hypothetical protein
MGLFSFLTGFSRPEPVTGGIYYTQTEEGDYSVLKILKLDDHGVHVRLYSNRFVAPPQEVNEGMLYMAGMDRKPGESPGMGHIPVSKKGFQGWSAIFVQQSTVNEEELEGYQIWLDARGGYF